MLATRGVYLFDEFDAIGGDRARPNDVGEMRRVLNSFLQFLETDESDSLILAATNHVTSLDSALFRRFDDVVRYSQPTPEQAAELIRSRLNTYALDGLIWDEVKHAADGLSYAEIAQACAEAAKAIVLADRAEITTQDLLAALKERQSIRQQSGYHAGHRATPARAGSEMATQAVSPARQPGCQLPRKSSLGMRWRKAGCREPLCWRSAVARLLTVGASLRRAFAAVETSVKLMTVPISRISA